MVELETGTQLGGVVLALKESAGSRGTLGLPAGLCMAGSRRTVSQPTTTGGSAAQCGCHQ
jgi:hypothetical protein